MANRILIDEDVARSTLNLQDALVVMDLRKERAALEKKIHAMAASFERRRKKHDDRIAEIDVAVAEYLKAGER